MMYKFYECLNIALFCHQCLPMFKKDLYYFQIIVPGVNLASPRFGCSLIAGENGTYPHFFVEHSLDSDELNVNKLDIESLKISEDVSSNIDYSERNVIPGDANDDSDIIEDDDTDEEQDEIHCRSHHFQQQNNDQTQTPTMDMMSDISGILLTFSRINS